MSRTRDIYWRRGDILYTSLWLWAKGDANSIAQQKSAERQENTAKFLLHKVLFVQAPAAEEDFAEIVGDHLEISINTAKMYF